MKYDGYIWLQQFSSMKKNFLIAVMLLVVFSLHSQQLLTSAEKSSYSSTSTWQDVMDFTGHLLREYTSIRMDTLAVSVEGRLIPLFVLADPLPLSPEDLDSDNRIVVYIQANIHAGEVEGKEATQMLMRDLLKNPPENFFRDVVLLVCPVFNADGNDKISKNNRTNQNGPVNGVGVRHNGQWLDLNRDAMKLETPEMRGLVQNVFNRWDPAIAVDCHTTNGSYHEEPVTFTWMMNPNGSRELINYMRDRLAPQVHKTLADKYHVPNVYYGEFIDRLNPEKGWISYASEPRYWVNYYGVRNRLAILNENYVYADFKTRVNGSYYLLRSILEYAQNNKDEIREMLRRTDERMTFSPPDSFAIEYKGFPTPEPITIKAIEADTIPGARGYWRFKMSDRHRTVTVPYIADYYPVRSVPVPDAWILTVPDPEILDNLKLHGITVLDVTSDTTLPVTRFAPEKLEPASRLFQGHYVNTVEGKYVLDTVQVTGIMKVIPSAQPLGWLAAYLLEPESDDGYTKWNFLDRYLVPQWGRGFYPWPVLKYSGKWLP
ncbi:MAG: M14 family metallopeptidase [Bacteroidales bacterium]